MKTGRNGRYGRNWKKWKIWKKLEKRARMLAEITIVYKSVIDVY